MGELAHNQRKRHKEKVAGEKNGKTEIHQPKGIE